MRIEEAEQALATLKKAKPTARVTIAAHLELIGNKAIIEAAKARAAEADAEVGEISAHHYFDFSEFNAAFEDLHTALDEADITEIKTELARLEEALADLKEEAAQAEEDAFDEIHGSYEDQVGFDYRAAIGAI